MNREYNTQPRHDERASWREGRRRGDTSATFRPGDELRCPGWLSIPGYVGPCGSSFNGERVNPHSRVIIRQSTPHRRVNDPEPGTLLRCNKCGTPLEKITLLDTST